VIIIVRNKKLMHAPIDQILLESGESASHPMNYTNYEGKIVERFGIALVGWPCK